MKNISLTLIVVLLIFSVQGCWAGGTKSMASGDGKSIESDRIKKSIPEAMNPRQTPEVSGQYKLVKGMEVLIEGKIYQLCEDLLMNFNSFLDTQPMVCERKYNPELGFTTPDWKPISKGEIDWEILKRTYFSKHSNRMSEKGLEKSWPEEKARLQALADKQTILWYAEFDLDNEEGREKVLMLKDNECAPGRNFSSYIAPDPTLHVLDDSGQSLDKSYSRLDRTPFEAFLYKNHTYLAKWRGSEIKYSGAQLFIHDAFKPQNRFGFSNIPICTFQYIK